VFFREETDKLHRIYLTWCNCNLAALSQLKQ